MAKPALTSHLDWNEVLRRRDELDGIFAAMELRRTERLQELETFYTRLVLQRLYWDSLPWWRRALWHVARVFG